jgi:hypothetical protein
MNPLRSLIPAVYTALTAPPLTVDGAQVPVFEHLPNGFSEPNYVLLGEPTVTKRPGSRGCQSWSCALLVDCVTLHTPGYVSSIAADELASQVCARLDEVQLPLAEGYAMSRADAESINSLSDSTDGEQVDVHRYVRMRFTLYYTAPTPVGV